MNTNVEALKNLYVQLGGDPEDVQDCSTIVEVLNVLAGKYEGATDAAKNPDAIDNIAAVAENIGGGGGYTEKQIANDTVTLTEEPEPVTFLDGENSSTPLAWTSVKVNDIDLQYDSDSEMWTTTVGNIIYGINQGVLFVGDTSTETIVAGTYTVKILSLPYALITDRGQTDVSNYAAVNVDVVPEINSRHITIAGDNTSTAGTYYALTYVNNGNVVNAFNSGLGAGWSYTYDLYVDGDGNAAAVAFYTGLSTKTMTITGVDSNYIKYSSDKTMAIVYVATDNLTINVKVSG